jgi:hypothetical protein
MSTRNTAALIQTSAAAPGRCRIAIAYFKWRETWGLAYTIFRAILPDILFYQMISLLFELFSKGRGGSDLKQSAARSLSMISILV